MRKAEGTALWKLGVIKKAALKSSFRRLEDFCQQRRSSRQPGTEQTTISDDYSVANTKLLAEGRRHNMAQNINPERAAASNQSSKQSDETLINNNNHAVSKRLQKELMALMMSSDKSISAFPEGENFFKWIGTICGPEGTVYKGQKYKLLLEFPNSYPYSAPNVKFLTPCFHPNVDLSGSICLDILKDKWSALYDVRTILLSIQSLLGEPNNDSPLNSQASQMWPNQDEYKKFLDEFYEKHKEA